MKLVLLALLAIAAIAVAIYAAVTVFGDTAPQEEAVAPPWIKQGPVPPAQ